MGEATEISWTDSTWNPWRGCTKVSPGCAHCYMFRDQRRYGRDPEVVVRAAPATFNAPLRWKTERLVFTCSWSDWFHEDADGWRDEAWDIVRRSPHLTFQILTKRPELVADRLPADWGDGYPNVWLGVSIENARHTWRADVLRDVPAALRFISAEPLLGSLMLNGEPRFMGIPESTLDRGRYVCDRGHVGSRVLKSEALGRDACLTCQAPVRLTPKPLDLTGIDWVIVGGESGAKKDARPMHAAWAREVRDAVLAVSIDDDPADASRLRPSFHFKQWGSWTTDTYGRDPEGVWLMPDGTRYTAFHADAFGIDLGGACRVRYAGPLPGAGGRILDGHIWDEIPSTAHARVTLNEGDE